MKKVIYTVLTGNYDHLEQPRAVDSAYDYICFTDRSGQDGVWQLREIPFEGSPVLRARWAKLHPHLLLPDYDLSVFMDANLCIASADFYTVLENLQKTPNSSDFTSSLTRNPAKKPVFAGIHVVPHPERDCVWEELRYCYLKDKVSTRTAVGWYRFLKKMGMPRHAGLAETNILLRAHLDPQVVALDELWWNLLLQSGGTRDQLALTPALHQLGMQPSLLFGPGRNARNVDCVQYVNHPATGKENVPGKLNWANLRYNLRLLWRKAVLLCLR